MDDNTTSLVLEEMRSIKDNISQINHRMGGLEQRFDEVEQRFIGIDQRFDESEKNVNRRFDALEQRVVNLENSQEVIKRSVLIMENEHIPQIKLALEGLTSVREKNDKQDSRIDDLRRKTENHETRLVKIEATLNA